MYEWNIKGNIAITIAKFLEDRRFSVYLGTNHSDECTQENGIPQGSVLAVTLFLIAINAQAEFLDTFCTFFMFADDLVMYIKGKELPTLTLTHYRQMLIN